jgi:hypothetical protein
MYQFFVRWAPFDILQTLFTECKERLEMFVLSVCWCRKELIRIMNVFRTSGIPAGRLAGSDRRDFAFCISSYFCRSLQLYLKCSFVKIIVHILYPRNLTIRCRLDDVTTLELWPICFLREDCPYIPLMLITHYTSFRCVLKVPPVKY